MIKCEITNREFKCLKGLSVHLTKNLKDTITKQEYYNKYLKTEEAEGSCYFCGVDTRFINISKGYIRICNSKKCIGKTRATSTVEFLMYKYGYNKEEALLEQKKRASKRGKKIKERFDKELESNVLYNHERSPKTKEFWIKKGYSEEEAEKEVSKRMESMYKTSAKVRKENPEKYKASYNNKIEYYLTKGLSQEDAEKALKERQAVGRLDKFIERYGEEEGALRWKKRQEKWMETLEVNDQYIKGTKKIKGSIIGGYSEVSQKLFRSIEEILQVNNFYYATKNKEYFLSLKGNIFYSYDFCDRDNKKIIEFNGDIFHGNPKLFESFEKPNPFRQDLTAEDIWKYDKLKNDAAINKGFKTLIVWEHDYKKNPDLVVQKCIEFLRSK